MMPPPSAKRLALLGGKEGHHTIPHQCRIRKLTITMRSPVSFGMVWLVPLLTPVSLCRNHCDQVVAFGPDPLLGTVQSTDAGYVPYAHVRTRTLLGPAYERTCVRGTLLIRLYVTVT
jgi:hypothetical protein